MSGWMGNYEERGPSKFRPAADRAPKRVWPGTAFRPDSGGGYGVACVTGDRHDVLSKDAPAWQEAIISAAASAGLPLRAIHVGSAGKYRFWRLAAKTAAEAMQHAEEEVASKAAEEEAKAKDAGDENDRVAKGVAVRLNAILARMAEQVGGIVAIEATAADVPVKYGCCDFPRDARIGCVLSDDGREFAIPAWAAQEIVRDHGISIESLIA